MSEASTSQLISPMIVEEASDVDEMGNVSGSSLLGDNTVQFIGTVVENAVLHNLDLSNLLTDNPMSTVKK